MHTHTHAACYSQLLPYSPEPSPPLPGPALPPPTTWASLAQWLTLPTPPTWASLAQRLALRRLVIPSTWGGGGAGGGASVH